VNAVVVELTLMAFLVSLSRIKGMSSQLSLSIDVEAVADAVVDAAVFMVFVVVVLMLMAF
jgi:hypothetical protein